MPLFQNQDAFSPNLLAQLRLDAFREFENQAAEIGEFLVYLSRKRGEEPNRKLAEVGDVDVAVAVEIKGGENSNLA